MQFIIDINLKCFDLELQIKKKIFELGEVRFRRKGM